MSFASDDERKAAFARKRTSSKPKARKQPLAHAAPKAKEPPLPRAVYLPRWGHYVWLDEGDLVIAPALAKGGFDPNDVAEPDPRAGGHREFVQAAREALARHRNPPALQKEILGALKRRGLANEHVVTALKAATDHHTGVVNVARFRATLANHGHLSPELDGALTRFEPKEEA